MAKRKVSYFSTTATVDVEIDPDDLHEDGWHHESECGLNVDEDDQLPLLSNDCVRDLAAAVASLHRQAHPSAISVRACHEEPCRSLSLEQLALT